MTSLSFMVYSNSLDYECNQCTIVLKDRMANQIDSSEGYRNIMNISINQLYSGLYRNECPLKWDNVNGYIR